APSSISRLTDMGVKPFLVASAVVAILAQRLERRLCAQCKQPQDPSSIKDWEFESDGLKPEHLRGKTIYQPVGCEECNGVGYRGRRGVYELMEMNTQLRELAIAEAQTHELRSMALQCGMTSLQQDAVRKVFQGITTIEEVLKITHRQDLKLG